MTAVWIAMADTPAALSAEFSPAVPVPTRDALHRGRLIAERDAILAVIPPDPSAQIRDAELRRDRIDDERDDLVKGEGLYRDHAAGHALRNLQHTENDITRLEGNLANRKASRSARRGWQADLVTARSSHETAAHALSTARAPELARLDDESRQVDSRLVGLRRRQATYRAWATRHPEVEDRLRRLTTEIERLGGDPSERAHEMARPRILHPERWLQPHARSVDRGLSLGR